MSVRDDCRHYVMVTVVRGDRLERCRLGANEPIPFACPQGCVFFESRSTSTAGWQVSEDDRPGDPPTT
jgi:hypothetical protein